MRSISASAPARIDLAGGTLDLWPLHVLHPGSVTVNLAIDRRARCRVGDTEGGFVVRCPERGITKRVENAAELLGDPATALVGSLAEALGIEGDLEVEFSSGVPFGSGLGGSSALTVTLLGALERWSRRDLACVDRVDLVRDVETRVLGKPAGVQDYYPPLEGAAHVITFWPGETSAERIPIEPDVWDRYLVLFDSGTAHSSGMNNWEILRSRLEGDRSVAEGLEAIRVAAADMARALRLGDFRRMGHALRDEWEARRGLAPVVSTPLIEAAVQAALTAGAWGGKACGAGGGGCLVFLSPPERIAEVRAALSSLAQGALVPARIELEGLRVEEGYEP